MRNLKRIKGEIFLPGDKSISHRAALFSALLAEKSEFSNFNFNRDCTATLHSLQALGVSWKAQDKHLVVLGRSLHDWQEPQVALNAANSGTTARLLSGLLANLSFAVTLEGDKSLSRRPMERVLTPLRIMGAHIRSRKGLLPLQFYPVEKLYGIKYALPVASAQVKSCVLLAGLFAGGQTEVIEQTPSRDHTERLLQLKIKKNADGSRSVFSSAAVRIPNISMTIPGDFSSAAFFMAAALLLPGSELLIRNVSLNPTRTGFLDVLRTMGAQIEIRQTQTLPEPAGDLLVRYSALQNKTIEKEIVPNIIDEIPILAILASQASGVFKLKGAQELRHKESDRLRAITQNLRRVGVQVTEYPDGLEIKGEQKIAGGEVQTYGDHRIAMSFAIAHLLAQNEIRLDDPGCVAVSFPDFWQILKKIEQ